MCDLPITLIDAASVSRHFNDGNQKAIDIRKCKQKRVCNTSMPRSASRSYHGQGQPQGHITVKVSLEVISLCFQTEHHVIHGEGGLFV